MRKAYITHKFNQFLTLQIGRQILSFGDQRILGGANWTMNGLSFEGLLADLESRNTSSSVFLVQATENSSGPNGILTANSVAKGSGGDSYLTGIYTTLRNRGWNTDLYSTALIKHSFLELGPGLSAADLNTLSPDNRTYDNQLLTSEPDLPTGRPAINFHQAKPGTGLWKPTRKPDRQAASHMHRENSSIVNMQDGLASYRPDTS